MRIALIGYGKMGRTIEKIALSQGHSISVIIDIDNHKDIGNISPENTDVVIEFTQPESAFDNISACLRQKIPVVSGTTGWTEKIQAIRALCDEHKGAFFYASNYSIGVNLFFVLNEYLASLMRNYPEYKVSLEEIHHTEKKDAPSGTAITLAEGILPNYPAKKIWTNSDSGKEDELPILSFREPEVPGTHRVIYQSLIDSIEIKHTAFSREGFAKGALLAAEWLPGKQGLFGMRDLLKVKL